MVGSGLAGGWDISDIKNPKMLWLIDTNPPGRGPHTVSPIKYDEVPNFKGPDGLPRTYAFITDEAAGNADMKPCTSGIRSKSYMVDITDETHPFPVSTWQVPVGNFCDKGGRFGPHQHAEKVNSELNRFEDKLAWVAYFNAGIRVVDLSDPYNLKEVGYYMPKTNSQSEPPAPSPGPQRSGPMLATVVPECASPAATVFRYGRKPKSATLRARPSSPRCARSATTSPRCAPARRFSSRLTRRTRIPRAKPPSVWAISCSRTR